MATFYFNKFSKESYESQWQRYIQNQSFADDITQSIGQQTNHVTEFIGQQTNQVTEFIGQQTKDFSTIISAQSRSMQEIINNVSIEQKLAIEESTNAICGTFESGVSLLSNNLNEISFGIQNVRSEINDLASMLDWNFSLVVEQQRISNLLLGNIATLLRIPDIQKERQYYLEQGLKFFKNALIDNYFFEDALANFLKAEAIEPTDYFIMHRIGLVYMYSLKHLDLGKAEEYFKKAAKYAVVESMNEASISNNYLNNEIAGNSEIQFPTIDSIKNQAAESYLFAARCCYIQGKYGEAAEFAGKSFTLIPLFTEAGFTQAKALVANGNETQATIVLKKVIETDRYFSIKTITDLDLCQNRVIRLLLNSLRDNAVQKLRSAIKECKEIINSQSEYIYLLNDLEDLCGRNTYLDALTGLDILNTEYRWTINNYLYNEFSYPSTHIFNTWRVCEINFISNNTFKIKKNDGKSINSLFYDCNNNKIIDENAAVIQRFEFDLVPPLKILNKRNSLEIWDKEKDKLIKTLYNETDEWRLFGKCEISNDGSCLVATLYANDMDNYPVSEKVFLFKKNVFAPKEDFIGKFISFITFENENIENIRILEEEEKLRKIQVELMQKKHFELKKQEELKKQKIGELITQAQIEEEQQKTKWFMKNYKEAIRLYKMAAELGNDFAKNKVNELTNI